ncbi:unnamed protein product [Fraxinus pennsylvanica]|uniref:Uncharacterized protein n=1 Tax=Fraxinus pennsylvanica TaxID=56036 RepID=A0AAD2DK26_9LAMI|nr:unnamed protein product [Fraxinus pennsylvanica]
MSSSLHKDSNAATLGTFEAFPQREIDSSQNTFLEEMFLAEHNCTILLTTKSLAKTRSLLAPWRQLVTKPFSYRETIISAPWVLDDPPLPSEIPSMRLAATLV